MDLKWLNSIIDLLPDNSNYKNSFFDIAGFPRWETVNSNMLAFYFDKNEHGLGTLFIESLLMLSKDKVINFEDDLKVITEYRTRKGNYIDLVIKSNLEEGVLLDSFDGNEFEVESETEKTDWAIIIENKIDAPLYNNLKDYWNSVDATHKIGIVLSKNKTNLSEYNVDGVLYHNITHEALVNQVLQNLPKYFSNANEKHLILLKEYMNNIQNIYQENIMDEQYNKILNQFQEHKGQIEALQDAELRLLKFISQQVFEIFKEFGFKPHSESKTSKSKWFYFDNELFENEYQGLRFWVDLEYLIFNKKFKACFELYDYENTIFGSKVIDILTNKDIFTTQVERSYKGGDDKKYCHIYRIQIPLSITENSDFSSELRNQLKKYFFDHPNEFLLEAINALNQAKITLNQVKV